MIPAPRLEPLSAFKALRPHSHCVAPCTRCSVRALQLFNLFYCKRRLGASWLAREPASQMLVHNGVTPLVLYRIGFRVAVSVHNGVTPLVLRRIGIKPCC